MARQFKRIAGDVALLDGRICVVAFSHGEPYDCGGSIADWKQAVMVLWHKVKDMEAKEQGNA